MIFTDEFLFLHVPKTAGMSVSEALLRSLKGHVRYTVPKGHAKRKYGEEIIEGIRHEDLYQAKRFFEENQEHGLSLKKFKLILALIRNPYDLEVSRFHYLQKGFKWDKGVAQSIAMEGDFRKFAISSPSFFEIKNYFFIDGILPDNLNIIRYETFKEQIHSLLSTFLKRPLKIGYFNSTKRNRKHYSYYLDPASEKAIYLRYRFLFDYGYYDRIIF